MRKRFDMTLYKGMDINKDLLVSFHITFDTDGQYQTIQQKPSGVSLRPSFALSISEGYQKPRMFCPSNSWFPFVNLLSKSIKLISDNIYSIFPSIGKISWDDVDKRELERFQTEKCMYINGFSIIPIVYTVSYGESFPGIRITTNKNETVEIPFEDAIIISGMLSNIEPFSLSIECLKILMSNN